MVNHAEEVLIGIDARHKVESRGNANKDDRAFFLRRRHDAVFVMELSGIG